MFIDDGIIKGFCPIKTRLKDLFASTLNQETVKQKLLHNNPFMCSTFYWMIFDDGFVKMGDLLSKTMMGDGSSIWQKSFGGQFMRSLMLTSFEKASYTKGAWKTIVQFQIAIQTVSEHITVCYGCCESLCQFIKRPIFLI